MQKGLISKNAFQKFQKHHPWLTAEDINNTNLLPTRASAFLFGDTWWFCSPKSYLRLRRIGPPQAKWMFTSKFNSITNADQFKGFFGDWLLKHFKNLLDQKISVLKLEDKERCFRWVFSENDLIPGLIVDVFGDHLVAQINSAPLELFWLPIKEALKKAYQSKYGPLPTIIELRSASVRKKEGLDVIPAEHNFSEVLFWNGFSWRMAPAQAQKTGAYFDQRENHRLAALLAINTFSNLADESASAPKHEMADIPKIAWDLCSYQGGFSLHLLNAGLNVTAVDQSRSALDTAEANVKLNPLPLENFKTECADVFAWLKHKVVTQAKADLIVLDPPSFVKSRNEIQSALRGYAELNRWALECLNPGGLLVSCVCSHHITLKAFEETLVTAAKDSKRKIKIIDKHGPSPDHTPVLGFSEGHYLQAYFAQVES